MTLPVGDLFYFIPLVEFLPSTARIAEQSFDALDAAAAMIVARRFLVEVESWVPGGERLGLALERANAVVDALLQRGVSPRQLIPRDRGLPDFESLAHKVRLNVVQKRECGRLPQPIDAFDPKQNPRTEDASSE